MSSHLTFNIVNMSTFSRLLSETTKKYSKTKFEQFRIKDFAQGHNSGYFVVVGYESVVTICSLGVYLNH